MLPPWQRRGHLRVDQTRLCHRKQVPIVTTTMINTTRKGSARECSRLLIVLAAALRAPGRKTLPGAPANLELPAREEQAQPYTVDDYGYPPLRRRACPPDHQAGARPVAWSSSRRSGESDRCLRLTPRCSGCREKIIFSLPGWLLITIMILAIVTRDPAQLGRSGGDRVALLASGYVTH